MTRALVAVTALGLVAAACGSDEESDSTSAATTVAPATTAGGAATTGGTDTTEGGADTTEGGSDTTTGGSDTTAGGSATTAASGGDPLGTPKKATGAKVKVGYIGDGQSASIDNTDELLTAEATVEWANEYQNGLGGHEIELITCATKQDAALATDCANQMVTEGVVAVLFNVSGQSGSIAKPLQDANVPLLAWQAADIATDTESTFVFSNGLASMIQPATIARDEKFTKGAIVVIDVPGASGPAKALGVPLLQKAGVANPDVVAIAPGTADMGPQIQAALGNDPEIVHLIGDAAFCSTAMQALEAAGYTGKISAISQCIDEATIANLGDYLNGVLVGYTGTTEASDPDYQTFVAVVEKYADDPSKISLTSNPIGAFGVVTSFVRSMASATGEITQESVISTVKGAPELPLALGAGLKFKCDGKAIAILPAVCTSGFLQSALDEEGQPTEFETIVPGDLANLG